MNISTFSTPLPPAYNHCLSEKSFHYTNNDLEWFIMKFLLPLLILFGISGNILNLTVLTTPNMRTRSNKLLCCLALADIICLLAMMPHCLAHYEFFWRSWWFHRTYGHHKISIMWINNWTMAAASWLVFVICLERLIGIKYPLSVRKQVKIMQPRCVIPIIITITGLVTSYNLFTHECRGSFFCQNTQYHARCLPIDGISWFGKGKNEYSEIYKDFVRISPKISAVFMVMLPCCLVILSNVMLILTLRDRKKLFTPNAVGSTDSQYAGMQSKTEHKVTITVTAIVTCFTITQSPSALVNYFSHYSIIQQSFLYISPICTVLVILGKSLNFVLFCLSSANFRQRLIHQTKQGILRKKTTSRSVSMVTASTVVMEQIQTRPNTNRRTNSSSQLLTRIPATSQQHRTNSSQSMMTSENVPLKELTRRGTSFV